MLSIKYAALLILLIVSVVVSTVLLVSKSKNTNNQFTLIKESDEVFFKTESSGYQKITVQQLKLDNHTYIKTTTGQAQIILPNGSLISIDKESEMQINFDAQNTNIMQIIGNSWHRVKGLVGQGTYEVETPTAVASIRGTKFLVEVIKQDGIFKSKIGVTEGKVNVGQVRKIGQVKKIENVVEITKGKTADVEEKEGEIKVDKTSQDKEQTEWFKKNSVIDQEFDKSVEEEKKQGFYQKENLSEKLIKHLQSEPSLTPLPTPLPSGIVPTIFKNLEGRRFIDELQRKIEPLPELNQPEKQDENSNLPKIGSEIKGLQTTEAKTNPTLIKEPPLEETKDVPKSAVNPLEVKSNNGKKDNEKKKDEDIKDKKEEEKFVVEEKVEEKSDNKLPDKSKNNKR